MRQLSPSDDTTEFERLYEHYWEPITRYFMRLVHDQELARDLCQDTFERVLKHLSRQETNSPQTAYYFNNLIYRIAKNRAIDHDRHNKLINFLPMPESEEYVQFAELMVEGDEDQILERLWLQEAIPQLPQQYRECLLAKHYWGHSQKEIAAELGIGESTVSANITQGKTQLHRKYYQVTFDFRVAEVKSAIRKSGLDIIFIYSEGPDETGFRPRKVCNAKLLCDLDASEFAQEVFGKCEISWPASHHLWRRGWRLRDGRMSNTS